MESAKAAFAAGADACYLGGQWSARAYAQNFSDEEIRKIIRYAHLRGRKVYIALNTMLLEKEREQVLAYTRFLYEAMADAVIAADLGFIAQAAARFPGLDIHASTQSAVQGPMGAAQMAALGCRRVIAARESSLATLAEMAAAGVEVEAFCHGAMCSGVSGVCLLSGMPGERSGNRGRCAQPCRLPYTLFSKKAYHLSTKDLCTLGLIEQFAQAGVCALKIEGRMKNREYVAATVDAYRRAIDAYAAGEPFDAEKEQRALARIFNRGGFTQGYLTGGRDITYTERPDHLGVYVGSLQKPARGRAFVATAERLQPGDGVEVGGQGYALGFADPAPGGYRIPVPEKAVAGDGVYLRSDRAALERARALCKDRAEIPVRMRLSAREGQKSHLCVEAEGNVARAEGPVSPRAHKPMDPALIRDRLVHTGGTVFSATDCGIQIEGQPFLPAAALNALRRQALSALEEKIIAAHGYERCEWTPRQEAPEGLFCVAPYVAAQVRDMAAGRAAWRAGAGRVYLAPGDPAVLEGLSATEKQGEIWLVLPPYLSAQEEREMAALLCGLRTVLDGVLAPGPGGVAVAKKAGLPFVSDYWQNVANTAAAGVLRGWGAQGVTVSSEINLSAIAAIGYAEKETVVYGRLPLMNLRHCPVKKEAGCAACGKGVLGDRLSYVFPLLPLKTIGCLLQVYNAVPLAMEDLPALRTAGIAGIRLIFTEENIEQIEGVTAAYCRAWAAGEAADLGRYRPAQASNGHFFRGVE